MVTSTSIYTRGGLCSEVCYPCWSANGLPSAALTAPGTDTVDLTTPPPTPDDLPSRTPAPGADTVDLAGLPSRTPSPGA